MWFYSYIQGKQGLLCANFHEPRRSSAALRSDLLYWILPDSENKSGRLRIEIHLHLEVQYDYITPFPFQTKITVSVQPFLKYVNTAFCENSTNIFIADTDSRKERRLDVASPLRF